MKEKSKNIKFCFPLYDEIPEDLNDITAIYLRVSSYYGRNARGVFLSR